MKINYRPEIDGLRAISVLAVIFYHADFSLFGHALFQGGFIGVDIFFVISGYLITSLILKEINHTNQFSFKNFYNYYIKKIKEIPILSSSYDVYKKRNKLIIETLDDIKGPNVYRIYPEYLFCNTIIQNRCVTNNKEHLFYYDNNHLSLEGSKYVVNEIMKTIQQIKINEKN
jgi:hypothetical protein